MLTWALAMGAPMAWRIFEAGFEECSYGFRPKRSATQALERLRHVGGRGHHYVVDGDIQSFFDTIDKDVLMELLRRRICDRRVLKLLRNEISLALSLLGCTSPDEVRREHVGLAPR